jgi:hypothetical protein
MAGKLVMRRHTVVLLVFLAVAAGPTWSEEETSQPAGQMTPKKFRLRAEEIKPLVIGRGGCLASDHITVEGKPVGFMYRERADNAEDSGWRFFSGEETQTYVDNPNHWAMYDLNTIANYDPRIIPLLDSAPGNAFEWDNETNRYKRVPFPG